MASAVHERYVHFQHDGSHAPLLRSYSSTSEELLDDDEEALLQPPSRWSRWQAEAKYIYVQGKGMFLVTLAQFFAANMNVMTKYLEMDGPHGHGMDPFQVRICFLQCTPEHGLLYAQEYVINNIGAYRSYSLVCLLLSWLVTYTCCTHAFLTRLADEGFWACSHCAQSVGSSGSLGYTIQSNIWTCQKQPC